MGPLGGRDEKREKEDKNKRENVERERMRKGAIERRWESD